MHSYCSLAMNTIHAQKSLLCKAKLKLVPHTPPPQHLVTTIPLSVFVTLPHSSGSVFSRLPCAHVSFML